MANDEFCPIFDEVISLNVFEANIEHEISQIIFANNLATDNNFYFHRSEGLPIKLLVQSYLVLTIKCCHTMLHKFKIPLESTVNWSLINGKTDGVFKQGHGFSSTYVDKCDNGDCVIYFPPKEEADKNFLFRQIPISIIVKLNNNNNNIYNNVYENSKFENIYNINDLNLLNFENCELILTLTLKRKKSLLKKMFYDLSWTLKPFKNKKNLNISFTNKDTKNLNFKSIISCDSCDENGKRIIYIRGSEQNCKSCKLDLSFKCDMHTFSKSKMDIETDRFFTSECIRISRIPDFIGNGGYSKDKSILFYVTDSSDLLYQFRIINCPSIKVFQIYWNVTLGSFPCGNDGDSVIYCSPRERDLSKSPLYLSLYEKSIFDNWENNMPIHYMDQRKIWLLRRVVFGG